MGYTMGSDEASTKDGARWRYTDHNNDLDHKQIPELGDVYPE